MALTNLDKDTTTRLFQMLSVNDNNSIEIIKKNYSSFSQLKIISEQMDNLKIKAEEIIYNANLNNHIHNIEMSCKKIVGNYYYHYIINDKEVLSIISPNEWCIYSTYLGKFLYDYDNLFYKIND